MTLRIDGYAGRVGLNEPRRIVEIGIGESCQVNRRTVAVAAERDLRDRAGRTAHAIAQIGYKHVTSRVHRDGIATDDSSWDLIAHAVAPVAERNLPNGTIGIDHKHVASPIHCQAGAI